MNASTRVIQGDVINMYVSNEHTYVQIRNNGFVKTVVITAVESVDPRQEPLELFWPKGMIRELHYLQKAGYFTWGDVSKQYQSVVETTKHIGPETWKILRQGLENRGLKYFSDQMSMF